MSKNLFSKLFGNFLYSRFLRSARKTAAKINEIEQKYQNLSDSDLPLKTAEFKERIARGESLDNLLPEAYALVKNAARRLLGKKFKVFGRDVLWDMVHYDVQLFGGIALHKSMVAEIATGEGKTLVATLPLYLNALQGLGCHVATVNEYLAKRDAQWMGYLFESLGLKTSCVYASQSFEEKKAAYLADITYGTASEFGFDYLRDNSMAQSADERVQRGFNFCLIDEADSVLIDEARTPLIISGYDEEEPEAIYKGILPAVENLYLKQRKFCSELASEAANFAKSKKNLPKEILEKLWLVKKGMPRNRAFRKLAESGVLGKEFASFELEMAADYNKIAAYNLKEKLYFTVDEKEQSADLTELGRRELSGKNSYDFILPNLQDILSEAQKNISNPREKAEAAARAKENFSRRAEKIHALSQLLKAYALYERDVDYIVKSGKVEIIDKNTGRVMEGRRWSEGLHQAVEAKERVEIERENKTYATISIQNYFRMYSRLAGMTGTAESQAQEFADIYKLTV
ncbi:MAG: preprotein translocase subunit SecA, partial [Opitutales bacterium]|nr:preprotein translocase subunit SecA [Opitutales bacterium]MBR6388915.1 preprotein translocase subunit SecA [Opitutales bacterium]